MLYIKREICLILIAILIIFFIVCIPATALDEYIDPELFYSSYLGGSDSDRGYALAPDGSGGIWIAGETWSADFAVYNAYQSSFQGSEGKYDAFVSHFSSTGLLLSSTYLGGTGYDYGGALAPDGSGGVWVTGSTTSPDFPVTEDAYQNSHGGNGASGDAFVSHFSSTGMLLYSTYLGGFAPDGGHAIAADSAGGVWVAGNTGSIDFPVFNAYQSSYDGSEEAGDAFVSHFSSAGVLLSSTYLGGTGYDYGNALAPDGSGGIWVAGNTRSTDFPVLDSYQSSDDASEETDDAFVSHFSSAGVLLSSTYLGGTGNDHGNALAPDGSGGIWVTGNTGSTDFPVLDSYQSSDDASEETIDVFVSHFSSAGVLLSSTYLGGTGNDHGNALAPDGSGGIWVTGSTTSPDFPITDDAYQTSYRGMGASGNAYVSHFSSSRMLLYSTYLGGTIFDVGKALAPDDVDGVWVSGHTISPDFPLTEGAYQSEIKEGNDAFIVRFSKSSNKPTITFLDPPFIPAGSDAFTLEVTGTNFVDGAKVLWDGSERPTVFVSTTKLNATILKDDVTNSGAYKVKVVNPDGGMSDEVEYTVTPDAAGGIWTQVNASAGWSARAGHSSVVMPDGSIILMGGADPYEEKNDVWRSIDGGATWTLVNASAGWSARAGHSSVVMPDGSIILMGGQDPYEEKNDVWRSIDGGATWTLVNASAGWSARLSHSSVVLADGRIVLLGGFFNITDEIGPCCKNDVWDSTDYGATWTQLTASADWSPRSGHSSVVMADGNIMLFGGSDSTGIKGDVWRSGDCGATWTQLTAGADWSPRALHSSCAMPDGSIILMGGTGGGSRYNDVWRWTPSDPSPNLLPPPVIISPGDPTSPGPVIDTLTPQFTWNGVPGADGYGLYIRDLDSNILVFDSQSQGITITGTKYNLSEGILENGKQYRWNMNAHSVGGWGNYSERLYFKAPIPSTLLDPPVLLSPGNGESPGDLSDLTPTFSWVAVPGADKYGLYISDITEGEDNPDLIFNSQARGIVLEGTSYDELPLNILQKGKKYRWNMNSHNDSGWGIPNNDRFYFYTPVIEPSEIPVADFTINPPSPVADWTVVLDASESYSPNGGIITRYIWRIDNGLKFESFAPIHYYKFQDIDSHEIELTVIDETNIRSEPTTKTITVIRPVNLLSVRLTAPEKMSPWEAEEFFIDVINNGNQEIDQLFVKMEFPSEEFSLGNFYSKEGGRFYYDKENNPNYAFWLLEDIPANSHRQIRLWMTKKFFSHDSSGIIRVTVKDNYNLPNLFYPGIGWNPENEDDGETSNDRLSKAYDLDAILVRSYFETNKDISFWDSPSLKSLQFVIDLNAALHVYLAHRDIYTDKNYVNLSYPDGKNVDGSHYNIVFSHSGGTQTLYQKLKTQKITANYAVFVAPALLDTPNLTQLIRDGKVKKIFIIQSSEDILFWSHILYEEEHEFSLIPDKYSNKKPGINFQSPINTGWWGISPLVENINLENLPAQDDFWIGGDYPIHQLFSNVSVETGNPDDDHTIDIIAINNLYDPLQTLNPIHSNRVHKLLLLNLIDAYNNDQYPFDGTFPELQRVPLPESQTDSALVCYGFAHDPNEKYGPEGHHPADEPLHYTIEYENEGDGSAFGVYVTDILDPSLDDTTITISPMYSVATGQQITERGIYFPENRTVYWDVGTVPPGEGGYANISIKFLSTVPDGTCVTNYATVYFPTAFEETQTNTIVTIKGVNIPPEIPNLTYPGNNAVDIPVNGSLLWEGHDPNNETLMYDVYYGTSTIPPLVIENTTLNMYYYSELEGNTTYYWRILAKDPYGGVTSSEISQFTTEIPYHAYFTSNITKGQAPLTVQFTDNSTGNITSRLWSFGDGAIAENVTVVTHNYTQKGTYSVNLSVSGPDGEDTMTQVIHVLPSQTVSPSHIVCWGSNISGQCDALLDNDYIAVSGGYNHSVALRSNGSLVAWGENLFNQCTVPSGNDFIAIDCGNSHNLALKSDGSLVTWGTETTVPPGNDYVAIAAGTLHSLALRENGTIVAWGYTGEGACDVPPENDFVAIAAGRHSLALRSNGSLVAWGDNSVGECNVPPGNDFIAIDANSWHSLALRSNGSVAAWGFNAFNQCNVPPGNDFKAISAGFWHSLALKENGSVVAWGYNEHGECEVPQGMTFEQISAGGWHNIALTSMNNTITVVSPNGGEVWKRGSTQTLRWHYSGDPGSSVKIEALRGEKVLAIIASSIPVGSGGFGSYNLTFPYNTPLGSDYRIRITSTSNATYTDTSDDPFTVVPPIAVLSPNGGEEWQQGSTQTISWNYIGDPGLSVKIEALRGDAVIAVITPGTSVGTGGSGSMNLTLPLNTPLGTDYRIRISSPSNTTYSDTSDAPFKVIENASASISIVSPNGKEDYLQGSTQTIRWNYAGDPGSMVKLEALRGDKVLAVITPGTSIGSGGSGSYNLTFPYNTPLGSDYRIRITSTSNSAWTDMSDDPFVVSPAIELISPNGGENWVAGATYPITWTYSGNPGPAVKIEALSGESLLAIIASSYPLGSDGEGFYNLKLPSNTPLGNDYRFRITSTSYPRCTDTSEDPFTISG